MIVSITGEIQYHGTSYLVIESQGIGYKVIVPEMIAHSFAGTTKIFTHEVIRENEREIFGFQSMEALELFWKLISISGVGPRISQKIVCSGDLSSVKSKIMAGNLEFLTHIPGVGKKTAQKIILELKGVLAEEPDMGALDGDAVDALVGLGYSRKDAEQILSQVDAKTTDERIRIALKSLAR